MGRKAIVRVPASVANLGSGFDAMGMALNLYNVVELEETGAGYQIEMTGEGEQTLPRDQSNLVAQAISRLFEATSHQISGWRLRLTNNIPLQSGLGSSAAAIVGGLVAANAVAGYHPSVEANLRRDCRKGSPRTRRLAGGGDSRRRATAGRGGKNAQGCNCSEPP